ncbi:hypothetical protein ACFQ0H_28795 [Lysobacter gummosus]
MGEYPRGVPAPSVSSPGIGPGYGLFSQSSRRYAIDPTACSCGRR